MKEIDIKYACDRCRKRSDCKEPCFYVDALGDGFIKVIHDRDCTTQRDYKKVKFEATRSSKYDSVSCEHEGVNYLNENMHSGMVLEQDHEDECIAGDRLRSKILLDALSNGFDYTRIANNFNISYDNAQRHLNAAKNKLETLINLLDIYRKPTEKIKELNLPVPIKCLMISQLCPDIPASVAAEVAGISTRQYFNHIRNINEKYIAGNVVIFFDGADTVFMTVDSFLKKLAEQPQQRNAVKAIRSKRYALAQERLNAAIRDYRNGLSLSAAARQNGIGDERLKRALAN